MQKVHALQLNVGKIDLPKLVHKVTEVFALSTKIRGISIITEIADDLPGRIATDENRVR